MNKILGVVVVSAALCVMAWAQAPGEKTVTGPQYPRLELSGGYSYGLTDLFNTGNRYRLDGWNGEFGLNVAKWMGFVVEGGGNYGTSKISILTPAPFPPCGGINGFCPPPGSTFNVNTTLYTVLFGAQFPYRKWERVTPFGEVMYGHAGTRGEARSADGTKFKEVSGGKGLMGGGGFDYAINPRFALRFRADYLQTNGFKLTQDNIRVSVGIVIRSVKKKRRTLEDVQEPQP